MRNWVDSAEDRDYWRDLVNTTLNPRVPQVMELVNLRMLPGLVMLILIYLS